MKVKALTNGFMRKSGEWYEVESVLKTCYVIKTENTLTCVLKSDFLTEFDVQLKEARNTAFKAKWGVDYIDYNSENLPKLELGDIYGKMLNKIPVDIDKINNLPEDRKILLFALLEEVKA